MYWWPDGGHKAVCKYRKVAVLNGTVKGLFLMFHKHSWICPIKLRINTFNFNYSTYFPSVNKLLFYFFDPGVQIFELFVHIIAY